MRNSDHRFRLITHHRKVLKLRFGFAQRPERQSNGSKGLSVITAFLVLAAPCWGQELYGVKIYYGDGQVLKIAAAQMPAGWIKAPADNVQVVRVYYERTYSADGKDRRYADTIEGKDYYFWSPSKGFGATDFVREIPDDAVGIKIGRLLPDGEWLKLYNKAQNDHDF